MPLAETAQLLGNIGEFVAAIAVVATLVYLAIEVRQHSQSTRAATYSEVTRGWTNYLQELSLEDLEILITLSTNHSELSHPQFLRAYYLNRVIFRRMENDFYQYQAGTFDEATWQAYVKSFEIDTFAGVGARVMWKMQSAFLNPTFVKFMDEIVERAGHESYHLRLQFSELLKNDSEIRDIAE